MIPTIANTFYFDPKLERLTAKVFPMEYFFTDKKMSLVTVVGNCVSACIRDPISGIGGINNFMLPTFEDKKNKSSLFEHGILAMDSLLSRFNSMDVKKSKLEAKVFGAALFSRDADEIKSSVRNANFVRQYLSDHGISCIAEDLNKTYARKIYFMPDTGKVLVKKLVMLNNNTIANRDRDYADALNKSVKNKI
jgi:chemotaxis protein CheD